MRATERLVRTHRNEVEGGRGVPVVAERRVGRVPQRLVRVAREHVRMERGILVAEDGVVDPRRARHGEHGVADELLHRCAVALEDRRRCGLAGATALDHVRGPNHIGLIDAVAIKPITSARSDPHSSKQSLLSRTLPQRTTTLLLASHPPCPAVSLDL